MEFIIFLGFKRNQVKPKKGKKKQTGLWPSQLNFGFLNKNNNKKKKSKRPSFINQKSNVFPKQSSGVSHPSLEVSKNHQR